MTKFEFESGWIIDHLLFMQVLYKESFPFKIKGVWTPEEDWIILKLVQEGGAKNWAKIA